MYDLLKPHVANVLVCDPRKNALLKDGSKSDRIDARKLAELLRGNHLSPIYHGENGVRTLKELARSYLTITKDLTRVMSRIKAVYRSWAIPCAGLVPSSWVVVGSVLETLGSRGVSDRWSDPVCFGTESPFSRYTPGR